MAGNKWEPRPSRGPLIEAIVPFAERVCGNLIADNIALMPSIHAATPLGGGISL